ncbi:regulatory phage cox family protein [Enterobacter hormaechei]|nr:regulatory phage cox family protein [Enterobacter hormaechei]
MSIGSERNNESVNNFSDAPESGKSRIQLASTPSDLLSKEGFALYIGKTPRAVVEMAKAGKLPAFYMTDPLKPGGKAELWVNRREWDKYAAQLVEEAPTEWHDWKNRISYDKSGRGRSRAAA